MLPRVVEIEVHLSSVGVRESANLQVDNHQASQTPVKKQQIHPVPFSADTKAPLPAHEAEVPSEFQDKDLQALDQRFFEIALGVLILEVQEFEDVRVFDFLLGKHSVFSSVPSGPRVNIAALFFERAVRS